jgi:hypothetical protein
VVSLLQEYIDEQIISDLFILACISKVPGYISFFAFVD